MVFVVLMEGRKHGYFVILLLFVLLTEKRVKGIPPTYAE